MEEDLINQCLCLISKLKERGVNVRAFGSVAIKLHCRRSEELFNKGKRVVNDIDIIALDKDKRDLINILLELGYKQDKYIDMISEGGRQKFFVHKGNYTIDLAFNVLKFCHEIDLTRRIYLDYPTISVSDLLLSKLQIIELNIKDVIDMIALILEHDLGNKDNEQINLPYIGKILANNWGFFHTSEINLNKIEKIEHCFLKQDEKLALIIKVKQMVDFILNQNKSLRWKIRAIIGENLRWYKEVD